MISYKQFVSDYQKKFVCLYFDEKTNQALRKYAQSNGFNIGIDYSGNKIDPSQFDFHITVYFTWNKVKTQVQKITFEPFEVTAKSLQLLGKDKDVPVLRIQSDDNLKRIRQYFTDNGFKDTWPSWKPHVSLSYEKKNYNLDKIDPPDFDLMVVSCEVQNQ